MKHPIQFLSIAFAAAISVQPMSVFAENESISDEQKGLISTNCASVKLRLRHVQKDDSRNRVDIGARYETIATNLMLNFNMRLAKNNRTSAKISEQQYTFSSERDRFKNDFIGYSQELDSLINFDCKSDPQGFYDKLQLVRKKREDVSKSAARMNEIISKHRSAIVKLQGDLSDE